MRFIVIMAFAMFVFIAGCNDTGDADGGDDGISGIGVAEQMSGGTVGDVDLDTGESEEELLEGE